MSFNSIFSIQWHYIFRGVMVIVVKNWHWNTSSNHARCWLHVTYFTNILERGMNPTILPPAMGKYLGRLGSLPLVRQPVLEKENSEFKSVKLCLRIDLVSHPARVEGSVNTYNAIIAFVLPVTPGIITDCFVCSSVNELSLLLWHVVYFLFLGLALYDQVCWYVWTGKCE